MTNINLKDGQDVPKIIRYLVGNLHTWNFGGFASSNMESIYKKGKFVKTHIFFSDGHDNKLLESVYEKDGKKFPKEDHWVNIYGYTIMQVVWKPSGKVKFVRYSARDKTTYKYAKKYYPQAKWMDGLEVPKWVRSK